MPKEWRLVEVDLKTARRIAKTHGVPLPIGKLLAARGLAKPKEIKSWLTPDLADLYAPERMTGIKPAVKLIQKAIETKDKICVFGDFDVDGLTSTALLTAVLSGLGGDVVPVIPDRFAEGYGLNESAVRTLAGAGVKLLITVDCGISNASEIAIAKELGLRVVIVDHHQPPVQLPDADAIINPRQPGCAYPFKDLAGVGLAFKLAQAVAQASGVPETVLEELDLVALGTVADMAPLVGENRILVHHGLVRLNAGRRLGLAKLRQVAGIDKNPITASQVSFTLAPRLNAAGRLASASAGLRLLMTEDANEASALAAGVDAQNRERQKLEKQIFAEAVAQIEEGGYDKTIVLKSGGWHEGIKGIVASRLAGRFFRPTILFSVKDGLCIGSGRSIPAFDLHGALESCADHLVRWGGHRAAAGLSLREEDFEKFKQAFEETAALRLTDADFTDYMPIDLQLEPKEVEERLVDELDRLAPFGIGNPMPNLVLSGAVAVGQKSMGSTGEHLKMMLQAGNFIGEAVAFKVDKESALLAASQPLDVAFHLARNSFNGRTRLQIKVVDARPMTFKSGAEEGRGAIATPAPGSGFLLPAVRSSTIRVGDTVFVDKRGIENKDAFLLELAALGLPMDVYVRDEHEGVLLAKRIAKLNGSLRGDVTIVCQALPTSQSSGRIVLYQAPLSAWAMSELCATPAGGTNKLVYLLYNEEDLAQSQRALKTLCPDRGVLAQIYRLLREHGPFDIDEAAALCRHNLSDDIYQPATRQLAARCVKILAELKLLGKDETGKLTVISGDAKVELDASPSWRRAQKIREDSRRFADAALTMPPVSLCR